jgi:hypothetical protein
VWLLLNQHRLQLLHESPCATGTLVWLLLNAVSPMHDSTSVWLIPSWSCTPLSLNCAAGVILPYQDLEESHNATSSWCDSLDAASMRHEYPLCLTSTQLSCGPLFVKFQSIKYWLARIHMNLSTPLWHGTTAAQCHHRQTCHRPSPLFVKPADTIAPYIVWMTPPEA